MTVPVRYYCPHCETVVTLPRDPYLDDKTVTPYPLEGGTYVGPDEDYERDDVDGVRFVCGERVGPTERTHVLRDDVDPFVHARVGELLGVRLALVV